MVRDGHRHRAHAAQDPLARARHRPRLLRDRGRAAGQERLRLLAHDRRGGEERARLRLRRHRGLRGGQGQVSCFKNVPAVFFMFRHTPI